jgi:predicted nucleotidyltransferase
MFRFSIILVSLNKKLMTNIEQIINGITDTLKDKGVEKIILFGSYAYGKPTEDSDLDIIVVTSDNYMPTSNREKMELHHKYNLLIKKFRKEIPIDMLVYTKLMYQKIQESGSIFTNEINLKGKILYETINQGMA